MTTRYEGDPAHSYGRTDPDPDQPLHATYPAADSDVARSGRAADHPHTEHGGHDGHGGHGWMMLVCCIPMIVIAVVLVATGVAGSGALVAALLCLVMMAAMMFAMPGGHGHK